MPSGNRYSSPGPAWVNRFKGIFKKQTVLYDQGFTNEFVPSTDDLQAVVSIPNSSFLFTCTMVVS